MASLVLPLVILCALFACTSATVSLEVNGLAATVSNGNVEIAFKADSTVASVKVKGKNIATTTNKTFYLDWNSNGQSIFAPNSITVVENNASRVHFYWTQNGASSRFLIELHYVLEDGVNGIYSWAKYTNDQGGSINLGETRVVYRFDSAVLTQGTNSVRSGTLYLYSFLNQQTKIQDETWQLPDGSYYTKYDYSGYLRETPYQGVYGNGYGAFVISPSREYHAGGPLRQDLIVHQDSLITNYFVSSHFGGAGLTAPSGWSHIYGPWLLYFSTGSDPQILADVANQAQAEKVKWPYQFVKDSDYPTSRGTVTGTVIGQTKATVLLYDSTNEDFSVQSLGYLFNTETDGRGFWSISNVRPGNYKVVAYPIAGQGSENLASFNVTVTAGQTTNVPALDLPEPQNTIWNIGEADRKSDEYKYSKELRNYLYGTLTPVSLNFTVGQSNETNDWYYAQAKPGVWTIEYQDTQDGRGRKLRVALAAASRRPHLIVTLNGQQIGDVFFQNDQSIYRSALQSGTFYSNVFAVNNAQVVSGTNTLTLQISRGQIMYDAISLQRV